MCLQQRVIKCCWLCSGGSTIPFFGVRPYRRATCLNVGLDPMCRIVRSTLYSPFSAVGLLEVVTLFDKSVEASEVVLACDCVRV